MKNPIAQYNVGNQRKLFWYIFVLVLVLMIVMNFVGVPLNTPAAPYGIISFELAGSVERSSQIIASWDSTANQRAAFILGLDFLFIPVYVIAISLGCTLASGRLNSRNWPLSQVGDFLVWGIILAGILDMIENIALSLILFGTISNPLPQAAFWCASAKFMFVFLGLVYAIYGGSITLLLGEP